MKAKSGPSSSSTSRSHHLNFKEEPMVTNSDEEEEDDDDEVYGANSLSKAELDRLVEEHLRSDDTQTAAFWAEKRLAIDGGRTLNERLPQIAQYLAVLTAARSWQTIITMIERHCLFTKHMAFAFFNVNALFNRELFSEIIALPIGYLCHWDEVPFITPDSASYLCAESDAVREPTIKAKLDELVRERKYEARLLFLLSKTYLMVQNRPAAAGCLRHCLNSNPYCSEALHLAIDSRLLRANELQEIVSSSQAAGNATGTRVISHLLEIYDLTREPSSFTMDSPKLSQMLGSDLSFQSATAFRLYSQGCVQQAYKITSTIMHEFGYYSKCFLVHVGCLVHLNKVSELYQLGHTMVKLQPEREITWYAVGCYYYATGQYTTAKKFLNKCTLMNSGFGEGWLAYGHTLFYVEEHEQAMNCYLRASRILEGHFEPLLNIAVEYCFANNLKLATDFLHDAEMVAAGANAIVLHEQGTVAYMQHNLERAEQIMMEALRLITHRDVAEPLEHLMSTEISEFWEPLFNNLGHTLRKQGKYEQAILVHRKALLLGTSKADTWACIGVCYACLVSECVDTNTTNGDESGSSPTTNTATGVDDRQQQQPAKTGPTVSACVDAGMEALNKALALRPGDDLVKLALEKLTKFASDRTLQERFTLLDTTPDENLDTMVEERKRQQQQQQGCCSSSSLQNSGRRSRKVLGKGLDMVDPNTSGEGSNTHQDNNQRFSALCSSPMTSQQAAALPSSSIF